MVGYHMYADATITATNTDTPCSGESFYCIQLQLQGGQCIIISEKLKEFFPVEVSGGCRWEKMTNYQNAEKREE